MCYFNADDALQDQFRVGPRWTSTWSRWGLVDLDDDFHLLTKFVLYVPRIIILNQGKVEFNLKMPYISF